MTSDCLPDLKSREARLTEISDKTLSFFGKISVAAQSQLEESNSLSAASLAVVNTMTSHDALKNLSGISEDLRRDLMQLCSAG